MFTTFIVQPLFNLLVLIYALVPGHNFGLAIILFTIIIRLLMWPLVKKQLRQARAMRELQPELKKIKLAAKGNRQEESRLTMELYKEREINPLASIGVLIIQLPIILGLYSGLRKVLNDPHEIINFSYPVLHHLPWMQAVGSNIHRFDDSLFGLINLNKTAVGPDGIYWAALVVVVASAAAQFFQTRQLMPQPKDARSLRSILSQASQGKPADKTETNEAVGRMTQYLIPFMVLIFAARLAVALPLYWLVSSVVAYMQQAKVLREDTDKAEASVELVSSKPSSLKNKRSNVRKSSKSKNSKRRSR